MVIFDSKTNRTWVDNQEIITLVNHKEYILLFTEIKEGKTLKSFKRWFLMRNNWMENIDIKWLEEETEKGTEITIEYIK